MAGSSCQPAIDVRNRPAALAEGIQRLPGHAQPSLQQDGNSLQSPAHWQPVTTAAAMAAPTTQHVVAPDFSASTGHNVHQSAYSLRLSGNVLETYFMPLRVGNQHFDIEVDTGSSNLVLPGYGCVGCGANPHPYIPGAGAIDLRISDYMGYGDGNVYGNFYVDMFQLSTFEPRSIAVMSVMSDGILQRRGSLKKQKQGRFKKLGSGNLGDWGILGLGPEKLGYLLDHGLRNLGNDSIMTALSEAQGLLAVQLCDTGGFIWFGTRNCSHSQVVPNFDYITMPPDCPYYYAYLGSMSLEDQEVNPNPTWVIFDTGTNFLSLTSDVYEVFMDNLRNHSYVRQLGGFDSMGCLKETPHNIDSLPDLTVGFVVDPHNEKNFVNITLPASKSYMVQRLQGSSNRWCHFVLPNNNTEHIFGALMMRNFVIMFDTSTNRMGFAPQEPGSCTDRPTPSPPHPWPWWIPIILSVCLLLGGFVLGSFRHELAGLLSTSLGGCSRPEPGTLGARLLEQFNPT